MNIFTDVSVLDSLDSGAGFIISDLIVQKSFYLGEGFSIFNVRVIGKVTWLMENPRL